MTVMSAAGTARRHPQIVTGGLSRPGLPGHCGPMIATRLPATAILAALLICAPDVSSANDTVRWRAPVSPVAVVRHFDPPAHNWLPGHRGVDLRTTVGAGVRAAGSGRVTYAGTLAGRGVVTVDHGALRTTYEPVEALVEPGQQVRAGETIGHIATGTGHCGSGRCLHLGLRRGREYLDPMLLLGHPSARLRPW